MNNEKLPTFSIVKAGAFYKIPLFQVLTGQGLTPAEGTLDVRFVKGSKEDEAIFRQTGIRIEDLLVMSAAHLEALNKDVPNNYTTEAIKHIHDAIECLAKRTQDRENRGVIDTYKP